MPIEVSVAIIAVAFVILTIYIIYTLKSVNTALDTVNKLTHESTAFVKTTNAITEDIKSKIDLVNIHLGLTKLSQNEQQCMELSQPTSHHHTQCQCPDCVAEDENGGIGEAIVEWVMMTLCLCKKLKDRR